MLFVHQVRQWLGKYVRPKRKKLAVRIFETAPAAPRHQVGVAISGGGSRSLCAATGQLRTLRDIGVLNGRKIGHIAACSGGNLAASIFTYRHPKYDDTTLLGATVQPQNLVWDAGNHTPENLSYLHKHALSSPPTSMFPIDLALTALDLKLRYNYPWSRMWMRVLGKKVFERFQLNPLDRCGRPNRYLGEDTAWAGQNVARLASREFQLIPDGTDRPRLLTNTALFVDLDHAPWDLYPFEINGVQSGTRATFDTPQGRRGGGYMNAYGLGSTKPERQSTDIVSADTIKTSLVDAAGLSSAFYATIVAGATLQILQHSQPRSHASDEYPRDHQLWTWLDKEKHKLEEELLSAMNENGVTADATENPLLGLGKGLIPSYPYWSVAGVLQGAGSELRYFADGGNLEQTCIASLVAHGYRRIIAFLNTDDPLDIRRNTLVVSEDLAALFGHTPWLDINGNEQYHLFANLSEDEFNDLPALVKPKHDNHVFEAGDFPELLNQLHSASAPNGNLHEGAAWISFDATTVDNSKYDISGGETIQIILFYLDQATQWSGQLSGDVQNRLPNDFPNYSTLNPGLATPEVNLLSNFTAWITHQARHEIIDLCPP